MNPEVFFLVLLTLCVFVFGALNVFFRERTGKDSYFYKTNHSKIHVLKFVAINILFNASVLFPLIALFLIILSKNSIDNFYTFLLTGFFIAAICFICYGSGIYIVSIILKAYTNPSLRKLKTFKTQFMASHFFHGVLSHFLIYSGFLLAITALSLLNINIPNRFEPTSLATLLIILGSFIGVLYALAQVYNSTASYQAITGIFCTIIFAIVFIKNNLPLSMVPVVAYFLGACIGFNTIFIGYFLYSKFTKKSIKWDRPVTS